MVRPSNVQTSRVRRRATSAFRKWIRSPSGLSGMSVLSLNGVAFCRIGCALKFCVNVSCGCFRSLFVCLDSHVLGLLMTVSCSKSETFECSNFRSRCPGVERSFGERLCFCGRAERFLGDKRRRSRNASRHDMATLHEEFPETDRVCESYVSVAVDRV